MLRTPTYEPSNKYALQILIYKCQVWFSFEKSWFSFETFKNKKLHNKDKL